MNPKSAPHMGTVTIPQRRVKSGELVELLQSIKQKEHSELYYALQMTKENTAKLEGILAKQK